MSFSRSAQHFIRNLPTIQPIDSVDAALEASMQRIPDFSETEQWIVRQTLQERYREPVAHQLADADVRLTPHSVELTPVPVLLWTHNDCHFGIFKIDQSHYRAQFWYRGYEQFATDIPVFDDLGDCIIRLLQAQADHAATRRGD